MDSAQEQNLIEFLEGLGFKGETFTSVLRDQIQKGDARFAVTYMQAFGEDKVWFDLHFQRDFQFDAYRLEKYNAILRQLPQVRREIIGDTDAAALEERMKQINWKKYFSKATDAFTGNEKARQIYRDVEQLANYSDKGAVIAGLLQVKYWPEEVWSSEAKRQNSYYEQHRAFVPTEYGTCNTNLAYHILAGHIEKLHEELSGIGLEQFPGVNLNQKLEQIFSGDPDNFDLNFHRNEPEGFAEFQITVHKMEHGYYPALTYTTTLTPHPPIEHGIFNSVDSRELEALMQEIDWHNDRELFIFHEEEIPEFTTKVADIEEQMSFLRGDPLGANVADQLALKYWADATFFEDLVSESAWQYFASLPQRQETLPINMEAREVFNLLCGRAIQNDAKESADRDEWIRLDLSGKEQGHYPVKTIPGFESSELEELIGRFPVLANNFYQVRDSLLRGDLVPIKLNDDVTLLLEANPEQRTINVYTHDMRPIPVNLRFDPDWRPGNTQDAQKDIAAKQKHPSHKLPKKNKGRHL